MASWSVREIRLLCLLSLPLLATSALGPTGALASEPFGRVQLHADWAESDKPEGSTPAGAPRELRLSLRSLVALDDAELTVSFPSALSIKTVEPSWDEKFFTVATGNGQRAIRADLVRLEAKTPLVLAFEITLPPEGGGVVSFEVTGTGSDGRRVHEAIGFAPRPSFPAGTRRLGALEFPATVLPPEEPR